MLFVAAYIPILTFHAFDEWPSVSTISLKVFQRGMVRLWESGYRTLSLSEIVDRLKRGAAFPERSFALTFDDGYRTVYDHAFPLLQKYGMSATIFPTVAASGPVDSTGRLSPQEGRSMLSWPEMREMHRAGFALGAHTLTHRNLTRLPSHLIEAEVSESKKIIEDNLGAPVAAFAYPFGRHDDRTREIVRRHFACACSDRLSLVTSGSNLHALERIDTYYLRTDRLFDVMLSRMLPWYLRTRNWPRQIRRSLVDLMP
jgi:peptidoglycan/xylan/chitin deacetylase (PgdA/CDA1 family)